MPGPEDAAEVERSDDGRWIIVSGRRWRATDAAIPERFRQELVNELMAARRGVGVSKRAANGDAERLARDRVQAAKVALGERGRPWWEDPTDESMRVRMEAAVLTLASGRAPAKTICPSDAARAIGGDDWRSHMDLARAVARSLAARGAVEITQRGERLDPRAQWRGPIRIRLPPGAGLTDRR